MTCYSMASPIGTISISASEDALESIDWLGRAADHDPAPAHPLLVEAAAQLNAYFGGRLADFDLPLAPKSTKRGNELRDAIIAIPYGEVASYGEVARRADSGPRAIGQACQRNPLPIIVPCHRVIAARGKIGYYSGGEGVSTKCLLLNHELQNTSEEDRDLWAA
ncbi:MAG: methylated-DNA--[protein]-cysteine S-methyltransferase [Sphingomonadaceae bacterium]|nr:methylated-DNA--[protein]-cysteine S-methyltransferase [Sphingomonadaceae bacterium]